MNVQATATFSEDMNAGSISASSFELRDPGGNRVSAAVVYTPGTRTATLQPGSPLAELSTYTATVIGGPLGVRDVAGNPLATSYSWTFTTAVGGPPSSGCPCTIWPVSQVPALASANDPGPVEVGVKFRPSGDGVITGIRFYKGALNTGVHIGNLWSQTGTPLASATFAGESAVGWQEVTFANPVAVTANATYVASYYAPNGGYAVDGAYFATSGVINGPLQALANGVAGGNGVFRYGTSQFPTETFNSANYWVDVVFIGTAPDDTTPPEVIAATPAPGSTNIAVTAPVAATFNEDMAADSISATTFELRDSGGNRISAAVAYTAATRTALLQPSAPLAPSSVYVATIRGGASGVHDAAGVAMAFDYSWFFTTSGTSSPPSNCPCTVWPATQLPAVASANDPGAVEVGLKFRTSIDGLITGVRFYKGPLNTGMHVGSLWSSSGSLLASATFASETASGWQEVTFGTPVAVSANTDYVASYHAPNGRYAVDGAYFATSGVTSGPLQALANGTAGGNGVFRVRRASVPHRLVQQRELLGGCGVRQHGAA